MKRPLGAQISHMLKDRGVDVIFGIPGVHNQEMYRGIEEAGITHVLARHEQGAGFMADGYARATGQPGVAYVITGPGLCNIMTPIGQAYSDSVPMLVLSSCLDETQAMRGQLHQMNDQRVAAGTVADWSAQAESATAAYGLVERAFEEFELSRPRPKHIQVPIAQLEADAEPAPFPNQPALRTKALPPDVSSVVSMLNLSRRPLFILGGGCKSNDWRQILTQLGAACFTTYAGRGMPGANYPLDFGSMLPRPRSAEVIASADLVIAVGAELGEVDLWRHELGHKATLIRVDLDPEVLSDRHRAAIKLQTDSQSFARALWHATADMKPATGWSADEVAVARARWRAEVDAERPGIVPVADALREAMPADTMIYSDMTQFAYVAKEVWDMAYPHHWHHPTGFGTLGYGLPAGIGGAVARLGKPTAVIAGDYGFHYTMQELGVAVELGLSLPIILWDNGKLKEIEDSMVRSQIAPNAVVARNPDFCKLAEAFGALSAAPSTLAEMQSATRAAFDAPVPTLIHVTPDIL
ncbi:MULTISPECIES: thiamine pyrophosphate-binding protein [unclassified Ruegeria]|uniref:thiamine pyrophosphate-binding protein n=1 Tax=unclassified Ruegeria TaxID=2625375 RepID=UPI001488AF35|nr:MULTISPECIES: thiamine pyrophosphate-binding protein [unclassified Ruegeria]NOD75050.1 acetolactate synthase isozyme1 large subunit [Ruegeria sp. HKCCD4332]NOD87011.1 acetolactate synthase isozyme1 large subunit [Ruegeria sp. HKCCD4318]NOE12566.1 acetolactate synthase isozyme1 large subunit [Ruegeria sp. HKCCD4318-2]NOG09269.1 acetolactate synthase isozyme1 large subunit [Ruegeria sp. HKCCD4315]